MKQIFNLENKVSVITGGYGYLGSAMVQVLLDYGSIVVVAGKDKKKFIDRFGEKTEKLSFIETDICDTNSIKKSLEKIYMTQGSIDILVNNAQYSKGQDPENMSDEDWDYSIDGVLNSVFRCIREVLPFMKINHSGKIINISSMYGLVSPDFSIYDGNGCDKYLNPPHYGAAKAGLIQLTKYYAAFLAKYNIQVNAITPGPFPNKKIQQENPEFIERLKKKVPLNRIGNPEDLAGVCILLSSKASDFITGQNIIVDGGWTIQ